jgi:hypothetical protein
MILILDANGVELMRFGEDPPAMDFARGWWLDASDNIIVTDKWLYVHECANLDNPDGLPNGAIRAVQDWQPAQVPVDLDVVFPTFGEVTYHRVRSFRAASGQAMMTFVVEPASPDRDLYVFHPWREGDVAPAVRHLPRPLARSESAAWMFHIEDRARARREALRPVPRERDFPNRELFARVRLTGEEIQEARERPGAFWRAMDAELEAWRTCAASTGTWSVPWGATCARSLTRPRLTLRGKRTGREQDELVCDSRQRGRRDG